MRPARDREGPRALGDSPAHDHRPVPDANRAAVDAIPAAAQLVETGRHAGVETDDRSVGNGFQRLVYPVARDDHRVLRGVHGEPGRSGDPGDEAVRGTSGPRAARLVGRAVTHRRAVRAGEEEGGERVGEPDPLVPEHDSRPHQQHEAHDRGLRDRAPARPSKRRSQREERETGRDRTSPNHEPEQVLDVHRLARRSGHRGHQREARHERRVHHHGGPRGVDLGRSDAALAPPGALPQGDAGDERGANGPSEQHDEQRGSRPRRIGHVEDPVLGELVARPPQRPQLRGSRPGGTAGRPGTPERPCRQGLWSMAGIRVWVLTWVF